MQWNSVSDFLNMGGYGLYVWGSFGLCAVGMIIETMVLNRRSQAIKRLLKRQGERG